MADDERTPILPPREFVARAIRQLGRDVLRAGGAIELSAVMVEAGHAEPADIVGEILELEGILAGHRRAIERFTTGKGSVK